MRKLLLSIVVALGAMTVNAQEAGGMWVGGSAGFQYVDTEGGSTTSFKILPEFGYILSENLAIGANLGYARLEGEGDFQGIGFDGKFDGFVFAPFVRCTFMKGSMGSLFVDTGVDYMQLKGGGSKLTGLGVGFTPGLALTVSEKISLIGKFGFLGYNHTKMGSIKTDAFGFDLDLSNIQIGAAFNF